MDIKPDEIAAIIKAAPELVKSGAELVGALKLTDIGKAMLGEATQEFAESLRDKVRLYRFGNQLKAVKKAEKMVAEAGFTPKAVPIKLLFPLLEGASLEEDENLHDIWAALLANAASPKHAAKVRPGFIATLKQLAPDEAALLKWIYDRLSSVEYVSLPLNELYADLSVLESDQQRLQICFGSLEAAAFVSDMSVLPKEPYSFSFKSDMANFSSHRTPFLFTPRAVSFVEACRPPKPKS